MVNEVSQVKRALNAEFFGTRAEVDGMRYTEAASCQRRHDSGKL